MSKQACKRLRRLLQMDVSRKPLDAFAWPGGYPVYYVCADGGVLCPDCVNRNVAEVAAATRDYQSGNRGADRQWAIVGHDVHYEGPPLTCDHCGQAIGCAYPADDTDDSVSEGNAPARP